MANNLLLSHELIYLLGWMLRHDKPRLKLLIKRAVKNGLDRELQNAHLDKSSETMHELYATFLDFFTFVEKELSAHLGASETDTEEAKHRIASSLKQLNIRNIDLDTINLSMQQAHHELCASKHDEDENTKEVLLQKILKNWMPNKNDIVN